MIRNNRSRARFLLIIAMCLSSTRHFADVYRAVPASWKRTVRFVSEELDLMISGQRGGWLARVFHRIFRMIRQSGPCAARLPVPGLGFARNRLGLLGTAATEQRGGLPIWSRLVFSRRCSPPA